MTEIPSGDAWVLYGCIELIDRTIFYPCSLSGNQGLRLLRWGSGLIERTTNLVKELLKTACPHHSLSPT